MAEVLGHIVSGPRALDAALACSLDGLSAAELVEVTRLATQIGRKAEALKLKALAASDRVNAHQATDAASLTALVATESGVTRHEAAKQIRLANQIETAPLVKKAMTSPGMSTQKAAIITGALESLPPDLTAPQRNQIEAELTEAAQGMSVEQLRRMARRALETIDVKRADDIENATLTRDESVQRQLATFWIGRPDEHTGMVKGGFEVDPVTADMLRAVIDSKTSPRKRRDPADGRPEPRQAAGEAFVEIVRHLPRDSYGNHGGVAATLVVTVPEATLRGDTDRAGVTEYGTSVSAGQLRKLACDAGILPAVMNGASQTLDQGRTKRHHTAAQRIALAQRDQGCAFPDCDRPPGWTEAHHAIAWSHGGPTNLETGVLLCSHHHRRVHDTNIAIRFTPDGMPEFQIKGTWRTNTRYRPLAA